jgi:hypothetical protein
MKAGPSISFSTSEESGALFFSSGRTFRRDAECLESLRRYMKDNHESWLTFGAAKGYPVTKDNLIFVTGVDLAKDFNTLVYHKTQRDSKLSLSIQVPTVISAGAKIWKKTHNQYVDEAHGPGEKGTPMPPNEDQILVSTAPEDHAELLEARQCVFIRRLILQKRFLWVKVIKAGAGPHNLPPSDDFPGSGVGGIAVAEEDPYAMVIDPDHSPAVCTYILRECIY